MAEVARVGAGGVGRRRAVWVGIVAVLALALQVAPAAAQFDGDPGTVERVQADTPTQSAILVSQLRFPAADTARRVVLATNADYADALTGAILTGGDFVDTQPAGPLLLSDPGGLPTTVAAEIDRVLPAGGEVLVLGGPTALSDQVVQDVRARGYEVDRVSGATRYETAVAVADRHEARSEVDTYLLARGDAPAGNPTAAWADAISGSTSGSTPILLTPQAELHPAAREHLDGLADAVANDVAGEVILLGGETALSPAVADQVPDPIPTRRLAGTTRDGTAADIARALGGITTDDASRRVIAYDGYGTDGWAFGLPAATMARDVGAALMPVSTAALAEATARLIGCGSQPADLLVVGSTAVVPDATVDAHRGCPDTAPAPAIVLDGQQLVAGATIGGPVQPAIDAVAAVLGPPTEDTGWEVGCPLDADTANERYVTFGDLTLGFHGEGEADRVFAFWSFPPTSDAGLTTARGIGAGATNADVGAAYPEATLVDDPTFGPYWEIPPAAGGPMLLFVESTASAAPVRDMYGGDVRFCE